MNATFAGRILFAPTLLLLVAAAFLGRSASGQSVLAPPPAVRVTPPAVEEYSTNNPMDVFAPPEQVALPEKALLQWGPVDIRPHVFYRFLYGNGIPAGQVTNVTATTTNTTTARVVTTIQDFSPGVLFMIGRHWTLDYTPTWRFYSNNRFRDTLDHSVRLAGGTSYEDWIFGLSQSYASSSQPLIETGGQTDQQTYQTVLNASYRFNSKMSTDLALNQNFIFADQLTSSKEWSTLDWLNYQFWPRLEAGVGAGFGYVNMSTNSDMTYEQLQGRIGWRATDKISFQASAGFEDRQLVDQGTEVFNPVASARVQYQPLDFTRLSLSVTRSVAASVLSTNQITESTAITIDLNQRLMKKWYLDLSAGYQTVDYIGANGSTETRSDDVYTFNARLSTQFLKRGTASVFYQYTKNSSTVNEFSFTSSQVGLELGYRF